MGGNLTLIEIAKYYKNNFVDENDKEFHIRDRNTPLIVKFSKGNLGHLLGLHKFNLKRGEMLFEKMINGKISIDYLKKRNRGVFKENLFRMKFFIHLNEILQNPKITSFDQSRNRSVIRADYMLYNYNDDCKRFLYLGIRKKAKKKKPIISCYVFRIKKKKMKKSQTYLIERK